MFWKLSSYLLFKLMFISPEELILLDRRRSLQRRRQRILLALATNWKCYKRWLSYLEPLFQGSLGIYRCHSLSSSKSVALQGINQLCLSNFPFICILILLTICTCQENMDLLERVESLKQELETEKLKCSAQQIQPSSIGKVQYYMDQVMHYAHS